MPCSSCSKDQVVIKNCTYQADIECGKKCYGKDRYMYQFYLKWPWGEGEGGGRGSRGVWNYYSNLKWLDNFSETSLIEIKLIVIVQGFNVSLIIAASGAGMAEGWRSGVFSSHQVFLWVLQFSSLCKNARLKFQSTCKRWARRAFWLSIAKLPFI